MLNQTVEKLKVLKLLGMANALSEQMAQTDAGNLCFDERLALLVDREATERASRKLRRRLANARLKEIASMEDIDYHQPRNLDKALVRQLASSDWIRDHHNVLIVGPTGTGKTFLACSLAHKACLNGYTALYMRLSRLLPELIIGKGDGTYTKRMSELAKVDLLILDDWGLLTLSADHRRDLLEIMDDRHGRRATIITSQLPIKLWHETINDETLADAILDRLVHNSYRIELKGDSMRKIKSQNKKLLTNSGGK
jgi:DNA replication protein DnaC